MVTIRYSSQYQLLVGIKKYMLTAWVRMQSLNKLVMVCKSCSWVIDQVTCIADRLALFLCGFKRDFYTLMWQDIGWSLLGNHISLLFPNVVTWSIVDVQYAYYILQLILNTQVYYEILNIIVYNALCSIHCIFTNYFYSDHEFKLQNLNI